MVNYDVKKIYEWPFAARALILVSTSTLILLFGYLVDIQPYQGQIKSSELQEHDMKEQLQLMINKQVTMKYDIVQLPKAKALLVNWQQKILTKNQMPAMLDEILKTGQDNNLKIIALNPANEVKDGIYFKTPVSLDMTGTYDQIATFISQLANMPKLVTIDAFTLNNNNQNNAPTNDHASLATSDTVLSAQLDIEIYRR